MKRRGRPFIYPPKFERPVYDDQEQRIIDDLKRGAMDAEELYDLDELERYAAAMRSGQQGRGDA